MSDIRILFKQLNELLVCIMSDIPIRNIYYIILYAWDHVKHKDVYENKGTEKIDSINDVLVDVFFNRS